MRTAMRDFLDTGMYFAIGVAITSVFNTQVNQAILDQVAGREWIAIPAIMLLAVVLSLCSTSDAFIAAPMAVFSMAAKLACRSRSSSPWLAASSCRITKPPSCW